MAMHPGLDLFLVKTLSPESRELSSAVLLSHLVVPFPAIWGSDWSLLGELVRHQLSSYRHSGVP